MCNTNAQRARGGGRARRKEGAQEEPGAALLRRGRGRRRRRQRRAGGSAARHRVRARPAGGRQVRPLRAARPPPGAEPAGARRNRLVGCRAPRCHAAATLQPRLAGGLAGRARPARQACAHAMEECARVGERARARPGASAYISLPYLPYPKPGRAQAGARQHGRRAGPGRARGGRRGGAQARARAPVAPGARPCSEPAWPCRRGGAPGGARTALPCACASRAPGWACSQPGLPLAVRLSDMAAVDSPLRAL